MVLDNRDNGRLFSYLYLYIIKIQLIVLLGYTNTHTYSTITQQPYHVTTESLTTDGEKSTWETTLDTESSKGSAITTTTTSSTLNARKTTTSTSTEKPPTIVTTTSTTPTKGDNATNMTTTLQHSIQVTNVIEETSLPFQNTTNLLEIGITTEAANKQTTPYVNLNKTHSKLDKDRLGQKEETHVTQTVHQVNNNFRKPAHIYSKQYFSHEGTSKGHLFSTPSPVVSIDNTVLAHGTLILGLSIGSSLFVLSCLLLIILVVVHKRGKVTYYKDGDLYNASYRKQSTEVLVS